MGIPVMEMTLGTWQCWWHNTAILPFWFGFTNYFSILAWFEPRTATQLTLKFDCRIAVKLSIAARTRKHISVVNCDLGRGCNHLTFKADHFVLRLNIKTLSFSSNRAIVAVSMVAKEYWHQGLHSSVDLSIPTILRPWVWISTEQCIYSLPFYILVQNCSLNFKNNDKWMKRGCVWPIC